MSRPENNSSDHKPIAPEIQLEIERRINDIKTKAIEQRFEDRFKDYRLYITKIAATVGFLLAAGGFFYIRYKVDSKINEVVNELNPEKKIQNMMQEIDKLKQRAERELQAKIEEIKNIGLEDITPEQKEIVKEAAEEIKKKPEEEYSAADYFVLGAQAIDEGNFEDAIKYYQKAIQLKPDSPVAYNNIGYAYNKLGKHDQAIKILKKTIEQNPTNSVLYNNLGLAYNKLGKPNQAIEVLEKAIQLEPDGSYPYKNLASTFSLKKDKTKALKYLELAIDKGYDDIKEIEENSDLDFIRNTAEYKRIIKKLKDKLQR